MSVHGYRNPDGSFNWKDALIDAGIMACLNFFMSLGGMGATGAIGIREVIGAGIAACTTFFSVLALKRGLIKKEG